MNDFLHGVQTADIFSFLLASLSLAIAAMLMSYLPMCNALRFAVGRLTRIGGQTTNRVDDTVVEVLGGSNRWLMLPAALGVDFAFPAGGLARRAIGLVRQTQGTMAWD